MVTRLAERVLPMLDETATKLRELDIATCGGWTARKGPRDYQTNVDLILEQFICSRIREAYPLDALVSEENVNEPGSSGRVWVVDPLDGTRNFVNGRPDIAISIGLAVHGAPIFGAIALPMRRILVCHAQDISAPIVKGVVRQRPLYKGSLNHGLVSLPADFRTEADEEDYVRLARSLVGHVDGLRTSGAMAYDLATLSLGEMSARLAFRTKDVDCVAGVAIVRATGGIVTDIEGREWRMGEPTIVAAMDPEVHAELLPLAQRARSVQ